MPFPPVAERFERLEETLQICLQMWSDDDGPYDGKHYQLAETICSPQPIQQPRPPILIGGSGERKTLRLVAQYADACNLFAADADDGRRTSSTCCARHCDDVGRDYDEIEKTILGRGATRSATSTSSCRRWRSTPQLGVDLVEIVPRGARPGRLRRRLSARRSSRRLAEIG